MAARMHLMEDEELDIGGWDAPGFARQALASRAALAATIDHTLLQPGATRARVLRLCAEAVEHGFACVLVNPVWASLAWAELAGTGIPVGSVVGFPLGASLGTTKREEALALVRNGVHELEVMLNLGLLKSGDHAAVQQEIRSVVEVAHGAGAAVKVILETCLLTLEEKLRSSELAIAAGADFLKTSTGFFLSGATVEDVALLRGVAGSRCGIAASDGILTPGDARRMLEAGANRLGSSAAVALVAELAIQ
ncbi:MAG: deoxyribose-phosphate aldolase [Acidobacteriaceae bacterium]